jgi:hypothetical protein
MLKWGLLFSAPDIFQVGFSSGLFAKFDFVSGFYTGSGNATIIKASPAQSIVKDRGSIFPVFGTLRLFRRITAQHVMVWIPTHDAGFISKIVKKLIFCFKPHFICHNDSLSFLRAIPVVENSGMRNRIYDADIACRWRCAFCYSLWFWDKKYSSWCLFYLRSLILVK